MEGKKLQIIEDFSKHICIICHKRIMVLCGTPVIHIGGCCVGVDDDEERKQYLRIFRCHYHCYRKLKKSPKLRFTWKEVFKIMKNLRSDNTRLKKERVLDKK